MTHVIIPAFQEQMNVQKASDICFQFQLKSLGVFFQRPTVLALLLAVPLYCVQISPPLTINKLMGLFQRKKTSLNGNFSSGSPNNAQSVTWHSIQLDLLVEDKPINPFIPASSLCKGVSSLLIIITCTKISFKLQSWICRVKNFRTPEVLRYQRLSIQLTLATIGGIEFVNKSSPKLRKLFF